jgi:hypothetical protein
MSINKDYNNALTRLDEDKSFDLTLIKLLETIDRLNNLENNKLLTEEKKVLLEVSLWDKAKFYLSKLGRYKAGGKILGKGKIDQEAAAKIQSILDKKGNDLIKSLHDNIQKINAKGKGEFPNNQDPNLFLDIILSISAVYDGVVAASKLKPEEEGFLPVDVANSIISDLREYVKKYLDVDLAASYSVMDSEEEKDDLILGSEDTIDEDRSADVRKELQGKRGDDAEEISSERMKTLKSWKLPIALMGAGASFGALSWLIQYIFPAEKITTLTPEVVKQVSEEKLGNIKPGEGMTQIMNRVFGTGLSPSSSPDEVVNTLSKLGGGDPNVGVEIITQKGGIFVDPAAAKQTLTELVANPNDHGDTLKDVFKGTWAGTGKAAGDTLVTVDGGTLSQMVVKSFVKWTTKTVIKKSAVALVAGPVLKTIGVALLGAGALVKLFREKGKRQSRAKTLNDLLQSLQFVKGDAVLPTPEGGETVTTKESPKNLCNKNVDQLNEILGKVKERATALKGMKLMNYSDNQMFQKVLLDNFINSKVTSIKVNGKPISATLKQLYDNGLLEAPPRSRDINKKQQLPQGWENQMSSFFLELFKLFSLLNKSCKNNPVYGETKKLLKQLFLISRQGKGSYSDSKKRSELFKKLVGSLHNFFSYLSKSKDFTKGSEGKPSEEEIAKRRAAKEKGRQRQDKYGDTFKDVKPELAHHDRGDNVIKEEINRIKNLMK